MAGGRCYLGCHEPIGAGGGLPRPSRVRMLRHPQSVGRRHRAGARAVRVPGTRDDQCRHGLVPRARRQPGQPGGRARAPADDQCSGERAGQRRLRGRVRDRAGRRGGERHRGRRDGHRGTVDRGLDAGPRRAAAGSTPRRRAHPRGPCRHRCQRDGRDPRRSHRRATSSGARTSTTRSPAFARTPRPAPTVSMRRGFGPGPRSAPLWRPLLPSR